MIPDQVRGAYLDFDAAAKAAFSKSSTLRQQRALVAARAEIDAAAQRAMRKHRWREASTILQEGATAMEDSSRPSAIKAKSAGRRRAHRKLEVVARRHDVPTLVAVALHKLLQTSKATARRRKLRHSVTLDDLCEIWSHQDGKCAFTKRAMMAAQIGSRAPDMPSIDRIDSRLGYERENIHLVRWCVNQMKMDYSVDDFVRVCAEVVLAMDA